FGLLGLYNNSIYERRFREAGRVLLGSFISVLFVISYAYAVNRVIFPARLVPVYGFIFSFVFIVILRNLARWLRAKMFKYDLGITNLLIVGNTRVARELVQTLSDSRISGYRIVGVVGHREHIQTAFPQVEAFDAFAAAIKQLKAEDIHGIVQTELYSE